MHRPGPLSLTHDHTTGGYTLITYGQNAFHPVNSLTIRSQISADLHDLKTDPQIMVRISYEKTYGNLTYFGTVHEGT